MQNVFSHFHKKKTLTSLNSVDHHPFIIAKLKGYKTLQKYNNEDNVHHNNHYQHQFHQSL